ncbi:MAG: hypothetical protein H7228_15715 [Polaromonas sp.]|nr:hypothetical protein [Polaromonas sp.]
MTHFFYSSRALWPLIAFLGLAASAVYAQTGVGTAPAVTASAPTAPPAFSSVFDTYKPYTEEKTANWKQANDTTARIGGWRAYAKEAAEPNPAMVPAPAPTPAKP